MKNTLTIRASEGCLCECLDRVNDGGNAIYLIVVVGAVRMPKLTLDGEEMYLLSNASNVVEIPQSKFAANAVIKFNYSDETHTGDTFTITFPGTLTGDLTLKKVDNFNYEAKYTVIGGGGGSYTLPVASAATLGGVKVGETLTGANDGTLNVIIDTGLSETSKNPVQNKAVTAKLNEVFQSVSNGKKQIASAITDKGVLTEASATFATMAQHIRQIPTGNSPIVSTVNSCASVVYINHSRKVTAQGFICTSAVTIKDG